MVDVFDRHGVRFDPRLTGCSRFVRYSDYAALEAQLAKVDAHRRKVIAENERLLHAFIEKNRILAALEATTPAPKVTEEMTDHDPKLGTTLHLMKQSWESRQPTNSGAPEMADSDRSFLLRNAVTRVSELEAENTRLRSAMTEAQNILCEPKDELVRIVSATIVLAQALSSRK